MTYTRLVLFFIVQLFIFSSNAQTLYVDPLKGDDEAKGSQSTPVASLAQAVHLATQFSGSSGITIKLFPGLYLLTDQVELNAFKTPADTARAKDNISYTIEAVILPDNPGWTPAQMPVIQSVSRNNKNWKSFDHCTGFQVQRNNVHFRGLKFVGNSNPSVIYYYAIERHFPELKGLEVTQCIFVGNRNGAPIQGALFAQGPDIKIDHSIFYECKNAVLSFLDVTGFSLTNSIVYGSYEGAIWFGKFSGITFRNNIIANNKCFWIGMKDFTPKYHFENSIITGNEIFMGLNNDGVIEPDTKTKPALQNVRRTGQVELQLVTADTIPKNYLHPLPGSPASRVKAGIFKN